MKPENKNLLYVGNAFPHKNLERLIQAFKIVLNQKPNLNLVLVGEIDYFYQRLQKMVKKMGLEDKVIFTGRISPQELTNQYKNSLAYVFPSLTEGFGLPGLEAMAENLPVVCSKANPLPEIYGPAALYFDPENIQEIAKTILKIVSDENLRQDLKTKGKIQVEKYSWQKCAQQTLKVYQDVLNL